MSTMTATGHRSRTQSIYWTPYAIGIGIGVLSWIAFAVVNNPIGITTAIGQLSGGIAIPVLGADGVAANSYWAKNALKLDYGTLFLAGTLIGGAISAMTAGRWAIETVPTVWAEHFGTSQVKRYIAAFAGGVIAMYGARLANGCTSGNGISGGLQLALSGWVFLAAMFATGAVTAAILFRSSRT